MHVSAYCQHQNDSLLLSTLAARAANLEGIESRMSQLDNGPSTSLHQTTAAVSDPSNAGQYYMHCVCASSQPSVQVGHLTHKSYPKTIPRTVYWRRRLYVFGSSLRASVRP